MRYFYTVWYDEELGEMGVDHTSNSVAFGDGRNMFDVDNAQWLEPSTEQQQKVNEEINNLFRVMCEVGNGKRE
jgi:hypothetical protein